MLEERKCEVQLVRGCSYKRGELKFKRGESMEVTEALYHALMQTGKFIDPRKHFYHIHPKKFPMYNTKRRQVYFIRDMGIGDVLMVTPSLRAVKKKFPDIEIRYAVKRLYVPLFEDFEIPTSAIEDLNGRFNVVDLRGYSERASDRRTQHRVDVFARYLLVNPLEDRTIRLSFDNVAEVNHVMGKMRYAGVTFRKPLIGLALRGSTVVRSIPMDTCRAFVALAVEQGCEVILLDHEKIGWSEPGVVDATGQFSVRDLAIVTKHCDLVVSPDTGLYHIANAVGTPAVVVFSTIDPDLRTRYYSQCSVIWHGNNRNGCPCFDAGCHDLQCLKMVTPYEIMDQASRWINGERVRQLTPVRREEYSLAYTQDLSRVGQL